MPALTVADDGIKKDPKGYQNFTGIDRSRDIVSLERPDSQPLWECENAVCDYRGIVVREPKVTRRKDSNRVDSLAFYSPNKVVYAESNGQKVSLNTDDGHKVVDVYPEGSIVDFKSFRGNMVAMSGYQSMYLYDGADWKQSVIDLYPAFATTIQGRFFVAGMPDKPWEVHACRLQDISVFPEQDNSPLKDPSRAAFIDVSNHVTQNSEISGIGSFETNKLAIFTQNEVVVYNITTDYTQWSVDERAKIKIGCISGRSVIEVGTDLCFCSRHGVHMIQRSKDNGITVVPLTLSENIEKLYKQLLKTVPDPAMINSCYDQDEGSIHIFFPQRSSNVSYRLTYHFRGGYDNAKWSFGTTMNARSGAVLSGRFVLGGYSGLWNVLDRAFTSIGYENGDGIVHDVRPQMRVVTPILWMGDVLSIKSSSYLALQVTGSGTLGVTAYDETGRKITETSVQLEATDEDLEEFPYRTLDRTYRLRFQTRFKGLQFEFKSLDDGDINIVSFAVELNK